MRTIPSHAHRWIGPAAVPGTDGRRRPGRGGHPHRRRDGARQGRGRSRRRPRSRGRRPRRGVLARDPARIHARSQHHQPEQRRRLAEPARRPRGLQALPGRLEPVAGVPHVAGARAEPRSGPAQARRQRRLRSRGARDHAQRQRGAADRAARDRPRARRRSPHHQPGLRPHARHLGAAGEAQRDRAEEDRLPRPAAVPGRSGARASRPPSRRAPR